MLQEHPFERSDLSTSSIILDCGINFFSQAKFTEVSIFCNSLCQLASVIFSSNTSCIQQSCQQSCFVCINTWNLNRILEMCMY